VPQRERRKAGALLEGNAQAAPDEFRTLVCNADVVGQCAFRRSASLFYARDLVRKPQLHFSGSRVAGSGLHTIFLGVVA
jgi:hypothetical protein